MCMCDIWLVDIIPLMYIFLLLFKIEGAGFKNTVKQIKGEKCDVNKHYLGQKL